MEGDAPSSPRRDLSLASTSARATLAGVKRLLFSAAVLSFALVSSVAAAPRARLDATTLDAWEFVTPEKTVRAATVCTPQPDGSLLCAGTPTGFLATKATPADYTLHLEWRWTAKPGNGGVLLHITSGPRARAWPVSFQVQTKLKPVGDLLPMAGATFAEPLTSAPNTTPTKARLAADSERPAGEWNSCDIVCRGDTITVTVNGVEQNRVTGTSARAGRIGLQFEGAPFAIRAMRLEPLAQ